MGVWVLRVGPSPNLNTQYPPQVGANRLYAIALRVTFL
jgi:hypothetical protein